MDTEELGLDSFSQLSSIENIDMSGRLEGYEEVIEFGKNNGGEFIDGVILGRVFQTSDEAFDFYNSYAKAKGFGIRVKYSNRSQKTNEIYRRRYVCSKEGEKNLNDKRVDVGSVKRRRDTRTKCEAMFQIKLSNGEWVVEKFNDAHYHPMIATPSKVIKFSSHNKLHLSDACKSLVSELNQAGLTSSKISKVVNVMNKDVHITPTQCSTILSTHRRNNVGRECYGIIKHFQKKADLDGAFYFAMDLATDGTLRSVFWADGRSRASYAQFGDVLVFDVTYKTNKFKFPFAPFVGVNHHGQSTLFGAALLEDETEATFVWLFEQFRRCMFDKAPVAIITDQDKAMGKAIKKVFPGVRHRFCAWHIKKHFLEHLQPFRLKFKDVFNDDYRSWYKSRTTEEFDCKWQAMKITYGIEDGSWLANMYELRHHWANAYLKDTFFAGMTTSGRSESINSFFDGYVNANTMLNDFVVQYDKAITSRREAEEDEDFRTRNSKATLDSNHPIEVMAGELYTRKMFEIFKKEWKLSLEYFHEKISRDTNHVKYRVGSTSVDKEKWAIVEYQLTQVFSATCSCAKFETWGILCKHILHIMRKKQQTCLPEQYVLNRWTMKASYRVANMSCNEKGSANDVGEKEVSALTLWSVRERFTKAIEDAKDSPSEIEKLHLFLGVFLEHQIERKRSRVETICEVASNNAIPQDTFIDRVRDPSQPMKTKGRPKVASRIKSGVEVSTNPSVKRRCRYCGGEGHNKAGCQKLKMDAAGDKSSQK